MIEITSAFGGLWTVKTTDVNGMIRLRNYTTLEEVIQAAAKHINNKKINFVDDEELKEFRKWKKERERQKEIHENLSGIPIDGHKS